MWTSSLPLVSATSRQPGSDPRYIYGIVLTTDLSLDIAGVGDGDDLVYTVAQDGLSALVSATSCADFRGMGRQEAVGYLVAHQQVVERVMQQVTVLPVKFGTVLPNEMAVRRLLEQGGASFRHILEEMAGRVQMEVVVTWDLAAVFREIGDDPAIVQLKTHIASRPPEETTAERVAVGQLVKTLLDQRRADLLGCLLPRLKDVVLDDVVNPLMDDSMVMNVALLVDGMERAKLDERLAELDEQMGGSLHFRCVGPLPPYSFATVDVRIPTFADIDVARRRLSLGETTSRDDLKRAYYRLASQLHPDVNPHSDARSLMDQLAQAYQLLTSYGASQAAEHGSSRQSVCRFDRQAVEHTLLIAVRRMGRSA